MADPVSQNSTGLFQSIYEGIFKGDFSSNSSNVKTASQVGLGLVPIAGQVADARDTLAAVKDLTSGKSGAWKNLAFSLAGWIPLAGDFLKSVKKLGFSKTLGSIGKAFKSAKKTWKGLWKKKESKMGNSGAVFYQPKLNLDAKNLPIGTYGTTNRWGDVEIRKGLDAETKKATLDHENVHSFFSPKLKFGQEFRANLSILGYIESHLLRRTEEGLAEAWARFKNEGIRAISKGWRFPLENPYGIDPNRLKIERNILIGVSSTAAGVGAAIGESITSGNEQAH